MANPPAPVDAPSRAPLPGAPVRWEFRPWRSPARQIVPPLLIAAALAVLVWWQFRDLLHPALVALLAIVSSWRSFVTAHYEIGANGIKVETLWRRKRIPWRDLERVVIGARGVFLIPRGSLWGWWQGLYLPWFDRRAEVIRALQQQAERHHFRHDLGESTPPG